MIRALLAVSLAAALLAAALPAVESAAADRTVAALDRDVDRLERAGESLRAADDPGARRIVAVSVPADSLVAVGVDAFVVSCEAACAVRYSLANGATRTRRLAFPLSTPDGSVRFGTPGDHRLRLGLADGEDGLIVTVRG